MNKNKHAAKLVFLAMMTALGVVISPILRVEGMCPMAHFINVTCAVMLGPWYAFVCALAYHQPTYLSRENLTEQGV